MEFDYPTLIARSAEFMVKLEGQVLLDIRVNVVVPEFNVVYLGLDNGVYAIQGQIGSEILGIIEIARLPDLTEQNSSKIRTHPFYNRFLGKRINQVRMIGGAWNGHGFELSFERLLGETMLIQSIYAGDSEKDFSDCLRLGIGHYEWNSEQTASHNSGGCSPSA